MVKLPKIPVINNPGNEELNDYLIRLERSLRRVLFDIGEGVQASDIIRAESNFDQNALASLRDGIIKASEEIRSVRDSINLTLENDYLAKSEAQVYAENALQSIELDGKGITQYFKEISLLADRVDLAESAINDHDLTNSELNVRLSEINAYIRTGRLDTGIYGIEIGNFHDGGSSPYKVRLSENRLSFFIGNTEVAYFSDNSMVIANANILEGLNIGDCMIFPDDGLTFVCKK